MIEGSHHDDEMKRSVSFPVFLRIRAPILVTSVTSVTPLEHGGLTLIGDWGSTYGFGSEDTHSAHQACSTWVRTSSSKASCKRKQAVCAPTRQVGFSPLRSRELLWRVICVVAWIHVSGSFFFFKQRNILL